MCVSSFGGPGQWWSFIAALVRSGCYVRRLRAGYIVHCMVNWSLLSGSGEIWMCPVLFERTAELRFAGVWILLGKIYVLWYEKFSLAGLKGFF